MGPIKSVLKEELSNSLRMKRGYERELAKLPKGSLVKKTIKGHEYGYLLIRDGKKVKFIYKGPISEEVKKAYVKQRKMLNKYRKLLLQVKNQIKFIGLLPLRFFSTKIGRLKR